MLLKRTIALITFCALFLGFFPIQATASLTEQDQYGGDIEAEYKGKLIHLPKLKSDIKATIHGDIANVEITQLFKNSTDTPLNARYLFPMNKDAAVYAMKMDLGYEIVEAKIMKKQEAIQTFEEAKSEGKAASLLSQHRPNMFTQNIANLMPDKEIKVTISYFQTVPKVDDNYELVIPLVVGPRYNSELKPSSNPVPFYPLTKRVNLPKTIDEERVSIKISLNSDIDNPIIWSDTHEVNVEKASTKSRSISLKKGKIVDNQDFVLRYKLSSDSIQNDFAVQNYKGEKYFSLLIEPIDGSKIQKGQIIPREVVFLIDTSGSMSGIPIEASKKMMQFMLNNLRKDDYFRIINFDNIAKEFSSEPLSSSKKNIQKGIDYVNNLGGYGGTEIITGFDKAFSQKQKEGTKRLVILLSDGYIGNEVEIIDAVYKLKGNSRVYSIGVGEGVNRYFMAELAHTGNGFYREIKPSNQSNLEMIQIAKKLQTPIMTNLKIDWNGASAYALTNKQLPDLFAGDSINVLGKTKSTGIKTIKLLGEINGTKVEIPMKVNFDGISSSHSHAKPAIPVVWARQNIKSILRERYSKPTTKEWTSLKLKDTVEERVTKLGLDFSLVTDWTSFIAVSKKVINKDASKNVDADVPLHKVKGVSNKAYGSNNFYGAATPEPATVFGLMLILLLLAHEYNRRKFQHN